MLHENGLKATVMMPGSLSGQIDTRAVFGKVLNGSFSAPASSSLASSSLDNSPLEITETAMAEEEIRHVSIETQNALYRSILSSYGNGLSDKGAMAQFALDHPDQATRALEAYQAQEKLVIEMTQDFLLGSGDNTIALEREMDRLLRMRGAKSRPATGVVDARGSRRRR